MRKIVVLFVAFVLCLPVFAGNGAYEFKPGIYYMMDTNVNIRSEPNLESEKLGKLQPGDRIEIIEQAAGSFENPIVIDDFPGYWYKIRFGEITGYVFSKYISVRTYFLGNIPNACLFFRYSDSSKVFYTYDVDKDIVLYKDGQLKNFPVINQSTNNDMSLWDMGVYYSYIFNPDVTLICFVNTFTAKVALFSLDKYGELHYLDVLPLGDEDHIVEYSSYKITFLSENHFIITTILNSSSFRNYNCTLQGVNKLEVSYFDKVSFISNYKNLPLVAEYSVEENLVSDFEDEKIYKRDGVKLEYFKFSTDFFLCQISCENPEIDFGSGIKVGCSKSFIENLFCTPDASGENYYIYRTKDSIVEFYFDEETNLVTKIVIGANL